MKIARVKSVNLLQESVFKSIKLRLEIGWYREKRFKMFIRPKHERNPVLGIFYMIEHQGRPLNAQNFQIFGKK